jgi:hypothetical protein
MPAFSFGPRKSLGLDFPGRFMAKTPFSVIQENSIRIAAMCCLTVGGAAWRCKAQIRRQSRDRLQREAPEFFAL